MNRFPFLRLLTLVLTLTTLASAAMAQETRSFSVRNFDKLSIGSAFTINVRQGGDYSLKATGRAEDIDKLEADVSGGTLKVKFKEDSWLRSNNHKKVTLDITMPGLKGIDFSGASSSTISGFRNQGDVRMEISGASTCTADLDARQVQVDFSGASSVRLSGRAERMAGDVSGATSLRAFDLSLKSADIDVSGASSAQVSASEKLSVEASGASSVRYRGAASVQSSTSGASSVRKEG